MSNQLTTSVKPGAFQPHKKITFRRLTFGTIRRFKQLKFIDGMNWFISELSNMSKQNGKTLKYYCNLCDSKLPYMVNISNKMRIKWNAACPKCSSRKRRRGLKVIYVDLVKIILKLRFYTLHPSLFFILF